MHRGHTENIALHSGRSKIFTKFMYLHTSLPKEKFKLSGRDKPYNLELHFDQYSRGLNIFLFSVNYSKMKLKYSDSIMDTALTQKFLFILDRNLATANCTENHVCTFCDKVVVNVSIKSKHIITFPI